MKGLKSKALALFLVLVLAALPMTALAAETQDREGESDAVYGTLQVTLPTKLDFTLDPLNMETAEDFTQISQIDFFMINKSDVPVRVNVAVDPADDVESDITVVTRLSDLAESINDADAQDKKILFGLLGADSVEEDAIKYNTATSAIIGTSGIFDYFGDDIDSAADVVASNTFRMFASKTEGAEITMTLAKATDTNTGDNNLTDTLADNDEGVSSFTFYAALNAYAEPKWAKNDFDVEGVYTFTMLRAPDYTTDEAADIGLNVLPANMSGGNGSGDDEFEFPDGAVIMLAGDEAENDDILKSENPTGYTVYLSNVTDVPKAVTGITRNGSTFATTNYSYNATTGALVITGMPSSTSTMIATATLEDDSTATFTWQVVA